MKDPYCSTCHYHGKCVCRSVNEFKISFNGLLKEFSEPESLNEVIKKITRLKKGQVLCIKVSE